MGRPSCALKHSVSYCVSGGDEPRKAQLGAPQRGPPRPDHSGGHTQPGQDQTPAGHQRGQETSRTRCEYRSDLTVSNIMAWTDGKTLCDRMRVHCVGMHGRGKGIVSPKVCVCVCVCVFLCLCVCLSVCMRECVKG